MADDQVVHICPWCTAPAVRLADGTVYQCQNAHCGRGIPRYVFEVTHD